MCATPQAVNNGCFARAERPYWFAHPYLCGYNPPLHAHIHTLRAILSIACAYVAQPSCCLQQLALGLRIFHACCMQQHKLFSLLHDCWYDLCKFMFVCVCVCVCLKHTLQHFVDCAPLPLRCDVQHIASSVKIIHSCMHSYNALASGSFFSHLMEGSGKKNSKNIFVEKDLQRVADAVALSVAKRISLGCFWEKLVKLVSILVCLSKANFALFMQISDKISSNFQFCILIHARNFVWNVNKYIS